MKNIKSQSAIEFLLILVFMLVLISIVMYVIGIYTVDLKFKKSQSEIDDFANSITNELNILQKVEGGFHREIIIPSYVMNRYRVNLTKNWLILSNLEVYDDDKIHDLYYQLPNTFIINYSYDNSKNEAKLTFDKKCDENNIALNLD